MSLSDAGTDMSPVKATILRTPMGRDVKVVERGDGPPVVFLHSGVGSAGEWKQVFALWPDGYRLVAVEVYRDGTGPGVTGRRSLDDYADQVFAVAQHVDAPVHLVGFSWGGATALWAAAAAPVLVDTLAVIEPETYGLLRTQDPGAYAQIRGLRDRWRADVRAGRWYEAFEEFVDFYNGPGSPAGWSSSRRDAFLAAAVDHAICDVVLQHLPRARHTLIEGAGHMMPLTHPEELTGTLLAFVESRGRG